MTQYSNTEEHCNYAYCRQVDLLPFTCEFCKKTFCLHHYQPDDHDCQSEDLKRAEKKVIICPVCDHALRLTAADDVDQVWLSHEASGECEVYQKSVPKLIKCPVKFCREQLTFSNKFTCKTCRSVICLKHRLPSDHDCHEKKSKGSVKYSGARGAKRVADYLKLVNLKKGAQQRNQA